MSAALCFYTKLSVTSCVVSETYCTVKVSDTSFPALHCSSPQQVRPRLPFAAQNCLQLSTSCRYSWQSSSCTVMMWSPQLSPEKHWGYAKDTHLDSLRLSLRQEKAAAAHNEKVVWYDRCVAFQQATMWKAKRKTQNLKQFNKATFGKH